MLPLYIKILLIFLNQNLLFIMNTSTEKMTEIQKAIQWVKGKGYSKIRSKADEFETPISYEQKNTGESFTPDITAFVNERKFYFEIANKMETEQKISSKWQLLSRLAEIKAGKLIIMAPRGHKAFAERLLMKNRISAEVISI